MIHFFRKMRSDLMNTNNNHKHEQRIGRYMKYAVGEIILVVIGILIALAINNWNSERHEALLYQKQLIKIAQNIASDSIQVQKLKQSRQVAINQASTLLMVLDNRTEMEPHQFVNSFLSLTGELKFVSDIDKSFQNQFENYQNTNIHELLDDYHKLVEEIQFREFRHNEFSENLETELWKSGFFRKIGTKFINDGGKKRYYSSIEHFNLQDIGVYDDDTLYALCSRVVLGYSWLLTEYDLLINKGGEMKQTITTFIKNNK